jgi:hypothetical protein
MLPTAMQKVEDRHETPLRSDPVGFGPVFGVGLSMRDLPLQDPPREEKTNLGLRELPTASHAVADTHDTLASTFDGFTGLLCDWRTFQAVPSQVSASVGWCGVVIV